MSRIILYNAKVYVEKGVYAEAVLTDGPYIKKTGGNPEIKALAKSGDMIIDCGGRTLIPGLNDAHMHLFDLAETKNQAEIDKAYSIEELISICKSYIDAHPEVRETALYASGWSIDGLGGSIPTKTDLDKISEEFPIVLQSNCGHYRSANSKAIAKIGLTSKTPQLDGGEFLLGDDGEPNGVFMALAINMLSEILPQTGTDYYRRILPEAEKYCLMLGITSVQSNDIGYKILNHDEGFALLRSMEEDGTLKIRYCSQTSFKNAEECEKFVSESKYANNDYKNIPMVTFGGLKLLRDGSITGRSALFREGYAYDRSNKGIEWHTLPYMKKICEIGKKYNVPVIAHAMGKQGIDEVISLFEEVFGSKNEMRNSIVHCEFTNEDMLDRIVRNNISILAQPINIDVDMAFIDEICDRDLAKTSFAFGTLLRRGAHVAYSTDSPMEDCNPFRNIYSAVTRCGIKNEHLGEFYPHEKVDRETAVDAYTFESAYIESLENVKGRIKEGYYADMALLSKDIFTCDDKEIPEIESLLTVVNGSIVYDGMHQKIFVEGK